MSTTTPGVYSAPARVNIIGEHTDYNDGFVLPTTTALYTRVAATPRSDRIVQLTSTSIEGSLEFGLDDIRPHEKPEWIDYARGVAAGIEGLGIRVPGANLKIDLNDLGVWG